MSRRVELLRKPNECHARVHRAFVVFCAVIFGIYCDSYFSHFLLLCSSSRRGSRVESHVMTHTYKMDNGLIVESHEYKLCYARHHEVTITVHHFYSSMKLNTNQHHNENDTICNHKLKPRALTAEKILDEPKKKKKHLKFHIPQIKQWQRGKKFAKMPKTNLNLVQQSERKKKHQRRKFGCFVDVNRLWHVPSNLFSLSSVTRRARGSGRRIGCLPWTDNSSLFSLLHAHISSVSHRHLPALSRRRAHIKRRIGAWVRAGQKHCPAYANCRKIENSKQLWPQRVTRSHLNTNLHMRPIDFSVFRQKIVIVGDAARRTETKIHLRERESAKVIIVIESKRRTAQ